MCVKSQYTLVSFLLGGVDKGSKKESGCRVARRGKEGLLELYVVASIAMC